MNKHISRLLPSIQLKIAVHSGVAICLALLFITLSASSRFSIPASANAGTEVSPANVTISGHLRNVNQTGLVNEEVDLLNTDDLSFISKTQTDAGGSYSFSVATGANYTVQPKDSRVSTWCLDYDLVKRICNTSDIKLDFPAISKDATNADFLALFPSFTVAGVVKNSQGTVLQGATVRLTGTNLPTKDYTTKADGSYTSDQLNVLGDYTFTPQTSTVGGVTYSSFTPAKNDFLSILTCPADASLPPGAHCNNFDYLGVDYNAVTPIQVTVQTNPAGRSFTVDGTTYTTTQVFSWTPSSSHTIATSSPQSGTAGTQYVYSSWTDGGAISHTVSPAAATTYTANFTTQYQLTMTAGAGGTTNPASGFFNSGQVVPISATPNSGFSFGGWTGSGSGSFTGSTNPANVTMNGPITETASFSQNDIQVTVQTNPVGRSFTVDGTTYTSTQVFSWTPSSSHTIATTSPQSGATGTQYVYTSWTDGGAISHTVSPATATTYTANFTTQYQLTMTSGAGGQVSPASGFFDSGQTVQISATPNSGFSFSSWTGSGTGSFTGSNNPATVNMNGPITETASFAALGPPPGIQFSAASYVANEGAGAVSVTVTRTGPTTTGATVDYATSDSASIDCSLGQTGKASSRCDYETTLGTLSFAPGETSKTITVLLIDDSFFEGDESFTVTLSNATGTSLGSPAVATVTIKDNDPANGPNPSDLSGFFVTLHYFDFFTRTPDQSGLAFWTNQIDGCTPQPSCLQVKRVDVSGAFYISIEFQQTGFLVERIYKAAFADDTATSTFGGSHQLAVPIVRFSEFLSDTQKIGTGVVVGQGDWQTTLENNKVAFTQNFVQRARFTGAFSNGMTPTNFVTKLNQNIGNVMTAAEVNTAIGRFSGALDISNVTARAQAVRDAAECAALSQDSGQEFRRAFVLMQYFGYLRRNPNDTPDSDYSGYDFWLQKLNQFGGDFRSAEMVKAFITSSEYRNRTGPLP